MSSPGPTAPDANKKTPAAAAIVTMAADPAGVFSLHIFFRYFTKYMPDHNMHFLCARRCF
jgi:hypothetical protein